MIPKKIHYCWFGMGEMNNLMKKCVKTFSTQHPTWEVKEWNEDNTPMNPYIVKCLKEKKWANVSNFVRLLALYEEGGIYLDTDVEVIKTFDELLNDDLFIGFESKEWMNNATMGATKGNRFLKLCIDTYLEKFDGNEAANISSPRYITEMLKSHYGVVYYNSPTLYGDGIKVYPEKYFYPYGYREKFTPQCVNENTVSIHHWAKTW